MSTKFERNLAAKERMRALVTRRKAEGLTARGTIPVGQGVGAEHETYTPSKKALLEIAELRALGITAELFRP